MISKENLESFFKRNKNVKPSSIPAMEAIIITKMKKINLLILPHFSHSSRLNLKKRRVSTFK
jgi:hypothetical protein